MGVGVQTQGLAIQVRRGRVDSGGRWASGRHQGGGIGIEARRNPPQRFAFAPFPSRPRERVGTRPVARRELRASERRASSTLITRDSSVNGYTNFAAEISCARLADSLHLHMDLQSRAGDVCPEGVQSDNVLS